MHSLIQKELGATNYLKADFPDTNDTTGNLQEHLPEVLALFGHSSLNTGLRHWCPLLAIFIRSADYAALILFLSIWTDTFKKIFLLYIVYSTG